MFHLFFPPTTFGTWYHECLRIRSSCPWTHTDSWTHSHSQSLLWGHSAPCLQHSGVGFKCAAREREINWREWPSIQKVITSWADTSAGQILAEQPRIWMGAAGSKRQALLLINQVCWASWCLCIHRNNHWLLNVCNIPTEAPKEENLPHDVRDLHKYQTMLLFPHWWATSLKKAQRMCLLVSWP